MPKEISCFPLSEKLRNRPSLLPGLLEILSMSFSTKKLQAKNEPFIFVK
jgi:hypothetical protein